jgi:hypothetical protein
MSFLGGGRMAHQLGDQNPRQNECRTYGAWHIDIPLTQGFLFSRRGDQGERPGLLSSAPPALRYDPQFKNYKLP